MTKKQQKPKRKTDVIYFGIIVNTIQQLSQNVTAITSGDVTVRLTSSDTNLYTVHKTTHRLLRTSATAASAEHQIQ
jgi:hypothetical protein